jgi:hypothetical protein
MPRIRREGIPEPLMAHLIRRVRQREISTSQLGLLARWLATDPEVPKGRWFKRFPEMIVCGEREWSRGDVRDIDGNGREAERAGANESIGEDVLTAGTSSCGRRSDLIGAGKFAMAGRHRQHASRVRSPDLIAATREAFR